MSSSVTADSLGNKPVGKGANDSSYDLDEPYNQATDVAEHVAMFAGLGQYVSKPITVISNSCLKLKNEASKDCQKNRNTLCGKIQ